MTPTKGTTTKRTPAKKQAPKKNKKFAKGDSYVCEVCGLAVTVDTACGCVETSEIICCGQAMKSKAKA
jgi:hypothetical protein